jgi:hypothetical protein
MLWPMNLDTCCWEPTLTPDRPDARRLAYQGSHRHGTGRTSFQRGASESNEGQALDFCIAKRIVSRSAFRGPLITHWARLIVCISA